MHEYQFETLQLHGGNEKNNQQAIAQPLYQTVSYEFDNLEQGAARFALEEAGNIYTRITNPTVSAFERRMALLESGRAAVAFATGTAAIANSILTIAKNGDHIIASQSMYGGTLVQFQYILKDFGITTTFVDIQDQQVVENAVLANTKLIFTETIGNPDAKVSDIEKLAEIAHRNQLPLFVDNTFATPYGCQPILYGADVVIHSATKFIGGHGTTMGGVVIDAGTFSWDNDRHRGIFTKLENYHDLNIIEHSVPFATKLRVTFLRDLGASLSPFNAWHLLIGLETLSLRMERHFENAHAVAVYLNGLESIEKVNFPGLGEGRQNDLAKKYLKKGVGSVYSFVVAGGKKQAERFISRLHLFKLTPNLGDSKSLVIHPASTTHAQLSDDALRKAGIEPGLIRISVGIEHIDDLIADLKYALQEV